jgi:heme A synthase
MSRFAKYAWSVLAFNLGVVLWGAFVRASGSGAGCGSHWPLCNGEVLPQPQRIQTIIEFTHRITSGVALLLVVGLVLWSRRATPKGHPARLGAILSLVFMLAEALLGAGLVLFEWVAHNSSLPRIASLGAHLLNTFLLLGSITLTAWWASGAARVRLAGRGKLPWLIGLGAVGLLVVGMTGAMTALGDMLFPSASVIEGLRQDATPTAHLLIRLRVLHPALAVAAGLYVVALGFWLMRRDGAYSATGRFSRALGALVLLQWLAGVTNIALLAPIWLQLGHLLLADLVWIAFVLTSASALAEIRQGAEDAATRLGPGRTAPTEALVGALPRS